MGITASPLSVQPKSGGFLKYRAVLIFASQIVLVTLTYYAQFPAASGRQPG